jgi:hypothetical protein
LTLERRRRVGAGRELLTQPRAEPEVRNVLARTGELLHAEIVVDVPLPADDDVSEVMEPCKEALGRSAARTISFADVASETVGIMPKKP